jgi:hypothetical protein
MALCGFKDDAGDPMVAKLLRFAQDSSVHRNKGVLPVGWIARRQRRDKKEARQLHENQAVHIGRDNGTGKPVIEVASEVIQVMRFGNREICGPKGIGQEHVHGIVSAGRHTVLERVAPFLVGCVYKRKKVSVSLGHLLSRQGKSTPNERQPEGKETPIIFALRNPVLDHRTEEMVDEIGFDLAKAVFALLAEKIGLQAILLRLVGSSSLLPQQLGSVWDLLADLARNEQSSRLAVPHLPGPEQAIAGMMPGKDRFWLDDGQRRAPVMPEVEQADPQQAVGGDQFQALCRRSPKHGDLVAQSQVLELEGGTRLEDRKIEHPDARSVVRKMGMSEDYEGCVTPIRSDISTFSRGTGPYSRF